MPTYSYRCKTCGAKEERVLPISQHSREVACLDCGLWMEQVISSPPAVDTYFEGSFNRTNPCDKRSYWS